MSKHRKPPSSPPAEQPLPWQGQPKFSELNDPFANRLRAYFGPDCKVVYAGPPRDSTKKTLGPYYDEWVEKSK